MNLFRTGILSSLSVIIFSFNAFAQTNWPSPEVEQMYKDARGFSMQGNLREAILLYKRAIQIAPNILVLQRDLANAYYLSGNNEEARNTMEPIIKSGEADEQSYQIMAASLDDAKEFKKARNMLDKGLEKYPHSGLLYHEMGKLYENDNNKKSALKYWLEGIQQDPSYHVNYYEAARTYMETTKTVWAIIYGEIFVNLEQQTPRANETRVMLIAAYKRLFNSFAVGDMPKFNSKKKSIEPEGFEQAVYNTFLQLSPLVSDGVNTENLIMLRTRFMIDWWKQYHQKYPFTLFNREDEMLREGYFDAYNQWLFGKANNQLEYEAWTKFHPETMPAFDNWLREHPMQPTASDFYNDKDVDIFMKKKKD